MILSWFVAQAAHATDLEAVGEQSGHRTIWGLWRDAKQVGFVMPGSGKEKIRAIARSVGLPVSQAEQTVQTVELELTMNSNVLADTLLDDEL